VLLLVALLLALVTLLTPFPLFALDPSRPVASFGQDTWQAEDGLPQNSVLAVAQTPDGYLWLGTKAGLVRFDGIRFRLYTSRNTPGLPYDFVSSLLAARDGTLWIGLNGGGVASLSQGRFKGITIQEGLPSNNVTALAEDLDGSLWIATEGGGLVRLLGDQKRVYGTADGLPADRVLAVLTTDDAVYAGTTAGLAVLRGGHFQVVGPAEGLASSTVISLARGPGRSVYVGTRDGGLDLFDGKRATRVPGLPANLSPRRPRRPGRHCGPALVTASSASTETGLTLRYAGGLADDIVTALFEDRGSLWIGTDNGRLNNCESRFSPVAPPGAAGNVRPCTRARGGTPSRHVRGRSLPLGGRTTKEAGLSSDFIRASTIRKGGSGWARGGGLNVRTGNGPFRTIPGLSDEIVNTLASTPDGTLWVGTVGGGLNAVRDGRVVAILQQKEGLPNDRIGPLVPDGAGGLWVGRSAAGWRGCRQTAACAAFWCPGESATISPHKDTVGICGSPGTGGLARLGRALTSFSALPACPRWSVRS
jgi:ligand-binding sensor domain-containing protein